MQKKSGISRLKLLHYTVPAFLVADHRIPGRKRNRTGMGCIWNRPTGRLAIPEWIFEKIPHGATSDAFEGVSQALLS